MKEKTLVPALAVALLELVAGRIVDERAVGMGLLALPFVVELADPVRVGGGPWLAGCWIGGLVLISLLRLFSLCCTRFVG